MNKLITMLHAEKRRCRQLHYAREIIDLLEQAIACIEEAKRLINSGRNSEATVTE